VEHRHDGKHDRVGREIEYPRRDLGHRVDQRRAVRVEHALRIAGGAAGVAEHARLALGAFHPLVIAVLGVKHRLETVRSQIVEADVMADAAPLCAEAIDERLERLVVEHHAVFGVVGDVNELFVEQARVDRVDDATHADRAVPGDEVMRVVHRQRRDPVTGRYAELFKRLGEFTRVLGDARPVGARLATVGPVADEFPRAVFARRVVDQAGNTKLEILHST
jgi:hypothetical protein